MSSHGKISRTRRPPRSCTEKVRLAQGSAFAVDACEGCDTLQLHLGALTLRLPADAVVELESTLQRALAAYARRQSDMDDLVGPFSFARASRGEA
jgi:hypothetical protein